MMAKQAGWALPASIALLFLFCQTKSLPRRTDISIRVMLEQALQRGIPGISSRQSSGLALFLFSEQLFGAAYGLHGILGVKVGMDHVGVLLREYGTTYHDLGA